MRTFTESPTKQARITVCGKQVVVVVGGGNGKSVMGEGEAEMV